MNHLTRDEVEKKLASESFPLGDFLSGTLLDLIKSYFPKSRERVYSPLNTLLLMIWAEISGDSSLSAAVIKLNKDRIDQRLEPVSPNTGGFSQARTRLDPEFMRKCMNASSQVEKKELKPDPVFGELKPHLIDGSTIIADDTAENQQEFPQHSNQAEGVGFPLIRTLLLQDLTTGMVIDFQYGAFKGKETGEMALARQALGALPKESFLMGDRYFPSYFLMADLLRENCHGLFQAHVARHIDFRKGKRLGKRDHLVEWTKPAKPSWMTDKEYEKYPDTLTLRETRLSVSDESGKSITVVTTLLNHKKYPPARLAEMYKSRWAVEECYGDLKTKMGMDHIRAKTPSMIEKVLMAKLIAYNTICFHISNAKLSYNAIADKLSFKNVSRILSENFKELFRLTEETIWNLWALIYEQIVKSKVRKRPGRKEPRVVKKRPKPYPLMTKARTKYKSRQQRAA